MKRPYSAFFIYVLILVTLIGCAKQTSTDGKTINNNRSAFSQNSILYNNTEYGFTFSLPKSWKGYSIISTTWEGLSGETIVETGPLLSIRHPKWTYKNPRQDIPIMIFTLSQWNLLQQEEFHIGAAPIGPRELGRNSSYVFALPARYNYAFPKGYEEVESILEKNPLKIIQNN